MSMMTSVIFKSFDSLKTKKSRYLEIKTFLFEMKEFVHYKLRTIIW